MKTLEWQNFFADQRSQHGKVIFSVAELANAARTSLHAVNTELGRLLRRGIICRYAQGRYGPAGGVTPEDIVREVDSCAYITGLYALFHHHLVTQVPAEVTCFTNRRHNRKGDRITPAGKLKFIHVPPGIYARTKGQPLAPAEPALCDFTWLCVLDGLDPRSLVTFRNLNRLNRRKLSKMLRSYPREVQATLGEIIGALGNGKG